MNIQVENIKCGGCASTITKKLNTHFATDTTAIDIENGVVTIDITSDKTDELKSVLLSIGYPEVGSVEGIKAATTKAKSFVSCAVGKLDT